MRVNRIVFGLCISGFMFFKEMGEASFLNYEHPQEYVLDKTTSQLLNSAPLHLRPYLLSRLTIVRALKETWNSKPLNIQNTFFYKPAPLKKMKHQNITLPPFVKLDFSIKYKGVKLTKGERPSLYLNYEAREGEIAEGFEASENLKGQFLINKHVKLVSYVGVFEKWVNSYSKKTMLEVVDTKLTGTIKYAFGCIWNIPIRKKKMIELDFLFQQTANNQWKFKDNTFLDKGGSGILFDHWVLTFRYRF